MSRLDKLRAHIQRWGWWRTCGVVAMKAVSIVFGLEVFVVRTSETPEQLSVSQCKMPGVVFRPVSEEELLDVSADNSLPLQDEFVLPAIERGDRAFGAYHDELLVAYAWRAVGAAPHYDDCWVRVARPYSYSYNSFARPEYRGQHLVPALLLYSDQQIKQDGFTHRVGIVAITNYASLEMGKHMGSHNIGHVGFVKWFGRYYFFRSKSAAEIEFELFQPS